MAEIRISDSIGLLVPENDTQELWQLEGRVDALRSWLKSRRVDENDKVYINDVLAIIGDK